MSKIKEQFYKNVKVECNKQNIKLTDLEERVGVAQGYYNKMTRSGPNGLPIDIIDKTAQILNVSKGDLLDKKYSAESTNYQLVIDFVDKLIQDTRNKKLQWEYLRDGYDFCDNPCFSYSHGFFVEREYVSDDGTRHHFLECNSARQPHGGYYVSEIYQSSNLHGNTIYLVHGSSAFDIWEIYIENSIMECVYSNQDKSMEILPIQINELIECIRVRMNDLSMSDAARTFINEYMSS